MTTSSTDKGSPTAPGTEDWRYHQEAVRDADHALKLLDDVDSLVRFCAVNMPDTGRYYRGAEAMWRVVYWIADKRRTPSSSSSEREAVARIIDPEAWAFQPWNENWTAVIERRLEAARAKADQILALLAPALTDPETKKDAR